MRDVYVNEADNRAISYSPDAFGGKSYMAPEPSLDIIGRATFDREKGEWVIDAPYVMTDEDYVRAAEVERTSLLNVADAVMLDWRTELMLGQISDENKGKLSLWLNYKNEVKAVDVSTAYAWPTPPAV